MKMNKIYCIVLVWRPRGEPDEFRLIDDPSAMIGCSNVSSIDDIVNTITDADSWVNIQAKSPEHAKRYFEVAYSKWREEFDDGIKTEVDREVLHNTKNVSWKSMKGALYGGHAVIPDDYYCDCRECELNSGLDLIIQSSLMCKECGVNPRWVENSYYEKTKFCEKCSEEMYRQHLDDLSIEDVNLTTSIALEKCDPTAYGIGFYEFVQSEELDDERNGRDSPLDG